MAISFDWYENPVSPDKPEEKRFHPRIIANGQIDTKDLRSRIQSRCTLNEVDVTAVLDALSQVMGEELCEGRQVHLDGIGYFYPTLTATEEIAKDISENVTHIHSTEIEAACSTACTPFKCRMTKLIVLTALIRITQYAVCLRSFFKLCFCLLISRIHIGMIFLG